VAFGRIRLARRTQLLLQYLVKHRFDGIEVHTVAKYRVGKIQNKRGN
jgi:hypothetical protein